MEDQGVGVGRLPLAHVVRLLVCVAAVAVVWTILAGSSPARAAEASPGRTLGGLTPALSATLQATVSAALAPAPQPPTPPRAAAKPVPRRISTLVQALPAMTQPPARRARCPQRGNGPSDVTRRCLNAGLADVSNLVTPGLRALDLSGLDLSSLPGLSLQAVPVLGRPPASGSAEILAPETPASAAYGPVSVVKPPDVGGPVGAVTRDGTGRPGSGAAGDRRHRPVPSPPPSSPSPEHGVWPPGAGAAMAGWSGAAAAAGVLWLAGLGCGRRRGLAVQRPPVSLVRRPTPRPA